MNFDPVSLRVLGTLIEKEITTPEYYPLSLNALLAGCNQKSSRDPVTNLDEQSVREGLHRLEQVQLVAPVREGRVPRFEHRARTVFNLRRDETAILCLLLLRGPQTTGELRTRADRMFAFDDLAAVQATLDRLMQPVSGAETPRGLRPLVTALPRQPGSREVRYAHLLGEPAQDLAPQSSPRVSSLPQVVLHDDRDPESRAQLAERVRELEVHLESLRSMMSRLEQRLASQSPPADAGDDLDS